MAPWPQPLDPLHSIALSALAAALPLFLLLVLMAWVGRKSKAESKRNERSELARIEELIRVQIERDGRSWGPLPPAMVSGDSDVRRNG